MLRSTLTFRSSPWLWTALGVALAPAGAEAALKLDVGLPPCVDDADCEGSPDGPYCEPFGQCRECLEDAHCPDGAICDRLHCEYPCRSDQECPGEQPYCDVDVSRCVGCLAHDHCDPSEYCSQGACFPDFCEAGALFCSGGTISRCDASGGDFEVETTCPGSEQCVEQDDGQVVCQAPMGGSSDDEGGGSGVGTTHQGTGGSGAGTDGGGDGGGDEGAAGGCRVDPGRGRWAPAVLLLLGIWGLRRRARP